MLRRHLDAYGTRDQHLAIDVTRAIRGFAVGGQTVGGTEAFYARVNDPTDVAKNAVYLVMTLLADSFVVRLPFQSLSPPL